MLDLLKNTQESLKAVFCIFSRLFTYKSKWKKLLECRKRLKKSLIPSQMTLNNIRKVGPMSWNHSWPRLLVVQWKE